ncbi:sugar ABC transporter ATP-binding protein [Thermatribacter velox]|uniref:Sugar ABC transporter ATP-binding protein n=1 Tax=Thermatribacter velox TaxID=3039681 RepID=A0ABZ2YAE5_9BACT
MVILEAKGIKKYFGGVVALSNGNLKCRKGRITGLLGANGSGKSTLSKIIAGVYRADAGEIIYEGKAVHYRNPHEARQNGIALVFQNLSLVPDLTVWQNIVLGMEKNRGLFLENEEARALSRAILENLMPDLDIEKKVYQLSPSEMQVVEIAKAISSNPRLLILDEPTAALEQHEVKNLFEYMRKLANEGVAMIFTSHRLWEVMEICDDVTIFRNGEDVATIDFDKEEKDPDKIIGYITGETKKASVKVDHGTLNGQVLLGAKIRPKSKNSVLKDIDLELRKGEILGIGGLAGQGQNELMYALAGSYPFVRCEVRLEGRNFLLNKPGDAIQNGIVLVPGDRQREGLFLEHSVYENTVFPKFGLPDHPLFIPEKEYRTECEQIVDILSIKTPGLDAPVNTLSGGNQQKVVVGKWLSFDIKVLLLADPAKGVDVGAKRDLYEYIVKLAKDKGVGVILYASDNEELVEHCDRVLIMYEGEIVASLAGEEISDDAITAVSMRVKR